MGSYTDQDNVYTHNKHTALLTGHPLVGFTLLLLYIVGFDFSINKLILVNASYVIELVVMSQCSYNYYCHCEKIWNHRLLQ